MKVERRRMLCELQEEWRNLEEYFGSSKYQKSKNKYPVNFIIVSPSLLTENVFTVQHRKIDINFFRYFSLDAIQSTIDIRKLPWRPAAVQAIISLKMLSCRFDLAKTISEAKTAHFTLVRDSINRRLNETLYHFSSSSSRHASVVSYCIVHNWKHRLQRFKGRWQSLISF